MDPKSLENGKRHLEDVALRYIHIRYSWNNSAWISSCVPDVDLDAGVAGGSRKNRILFLGSFHSSGEVVSE